MPFLCFSFLATNVMSEKQMLELKQRESGDLLSLLTTKEGEKLL